MRSPFSPELLGSLGDGDARASVCTLAPHLPGRSLSRPQSTRITGHLERACSPLQKSPGAAQP